MNERGGSDALFHWNSGSLTSSHVNELCH